MMSPTGEEEEANMSEANKKLVQGSIDAFNREGPDAVDRYLADEWVGHDSRDSSNSTRDDFKNEFGVVLSGFPDAQTTLEDIVAEGDRVATRLTLSGTHTKEYYGVAPTGKKVSMSMLAIDRIANGKIVESWNENSGLGFHYQLTGTPAPSLKQPAH
jgi:predicted ester cyclase